MSNSSEYMAQELVAFDYDGTITEIGSTQVEKSVTLGTQALWHTGVKTAIVTARPYQRLASLSGGLDRLISADTPFATERGARVVAGNVTSNLCYYPLAKDEVGAIIDVGTHSNIEFVGFYPEILEGTSYIWTPDLPKSDAMYIIFGHDATILPPGTWALADALHEANPCMVTIRFKENNIDSTSIIPEGLNVAWSNCSASLITNGVDKLTALNVVCEATHASLTTTVYAGNDENDLPILRTHGIKERILVGPREFTGLAEPITRVSSPDALGRYLIKISGE